MNTIHTLKQKRQYFHRLLLANGEAHNKELIINTKFGVESTINLNDEQLDSLINDALYRLRQNKATKADDPKKIRTWRNKCLLVLAERGITATPKDWQPINSELSKKQYQWILNPEHRAQGMVNQKGLYAFKTIEDLKKLFNQLVAIRDNEKEKAAKENKLSKLN